VISALISRLTFISENTVRSAAETILPRTGSSAQPRNHLAKEFAIEFTVGQLHQAPSYIQLGFFAVVIHLQLSAIIRNLRVFSTCSISDRHHVLSRWSVSKLHYQRDFVRFIKSSTSLAYFDYTPEQSEYQNEVSENS